VKTGEVIGFSKELNTAMSKSDQRIKRLTSENVNAIAGVDPSGTTATREQHHC